MAKSLKYWYEFADDLLGNTKRIEIYEEGFVGDETELIAGSTPLSKIYNKDVGEKYLGGVVQMVVNIEANSTDEFQAINFNATNYGDIVIRHLIDDVVQFNAIIVPFEGSDIDLPSGYFNVSLGAECGLNQLKNITYSHSGTRKRVIQIIKECLSEIGYVDTFPIKVLDNTQCFALGELTGVDYWETYIEDANFEGLSCLEVINQLKQVYNEIVFSDKAWFIRNVEEISRTDSNLLTYDWSTLTQSSSSYARPTETIQRTAGGQFGRLFSQQNIRVSKPKSALANIFPQGDMVDDTGWTYAGSAGLFLVIADGVLTNNRATFFTPTAVGADGSYIQSPLITFYPFQEWFDTREKERLQIRGKATKGAYIKNLRFQILAQAEGQTYFLTTEGTWYTYVSGYGTPIYTKTYTDDSEFVIDIPQPPYVTSSILTSADKLSFGEFGYFNGGGDYLIPDTNIAYNLYIRVMYPERIHDAPPMSGDEVYGVELEADIDYLHVQKVDISGVVENGFNRNFGVPETKDRKIDFSVSIGVGYPSYPSGLDCLFVDSGSIDQVAYYGRHSSLTSLPIDEHIAYSYLDVLANRLSFYQGTIKGDLEFTDLISIDSVKYRIHNLSHDSRRNMSTVKLVELDSTASTLTVTPIVQLDEETIRNINEEITKTLGTNTPLRFVDKNFEETILSSGERALKLRDDFKIRTLFSDEMFLRAASDGVITDVAEDTASDFTLIKPAENGTYATREWATDNAWLLNGNALTASKSLGSTTNYDVTLIQNSATIATIKSTGLQLDVLAAESTDVDKFLVSNAGLIKYRTGTQILSDIGAFATPSGLTTNYVTKWNGTALANSLIYDDGTDVLVNSANNLNLNLQRSGVTFVQFQQNAGGGFIGLLNPSSQRNVAFRAYGNTELNTITGNVGIGTTSPSAKLHTNYDFGGVGVNLILSNGATNSTIGRGSGILFTGTSAGNIAQIEAQTITASNNTGGLIFKTSNAGTLTERVRITQNGDIMIGIGNPSYKLDVTGTGHFTGSVTFDTVPSSLQDATTSNHLVRYSQWIASTSVKYLPTAVKTVSLTNITLSGTQTVNGVALIAGDRILVAGQTTGANNGVYDVAAGSWTRSTDSDTDAELRGFIVNISGGTYAGYKYINTNGSTITVGTTAITYSEFSNVSEIDPVFVAWRDTTRTANTFWAAPNGSNGAATWRALVAADVPTLNQNTTGSAATLTTSRNIAISGDLTWNVDFNGSAAVSGVGTLATVNSNVGTFRSVTVNAKGLVTAATNPTTLSGYGITDAQPLNSSLTNLAALAISTGIMVQTTGDGQFVVRSLTGTTDKISVSNGNGGAGNPTIDISSSYVGQASITTLGTITTGTWNGGIIPTLYGGTGSSTQNFVDLTTDQEIDGIKEFYDEIKVKSNQIHLTSDFLNRGGSVASYGVLSNKLGAGGLILDVKTTGGLYFRVDTTRKGLFDTNGLILSSSLGNSDVPTERLDVRGNIRYNTLLKPNNIAGTSGQFLGTSGTQDAWTTLTTSHISNLSSYTGFTNYFTETEIIAGYQPLDDTLTSLAALTVSTGILVQTTGDSQFVLRSITGTTDRVSVSNGNGGAGNPTIDIASTYVGQTSITTLGTIGTGTWNGTTISTAKGGTGLTALGTAGQLLKVNAGATALEYFTLGISNVSGLQTALDGKQSTLPSGTAGQFFVRDSTGALNFMDLKIKPIGLSSERIGVGNVDNFLGEQPFFLFKDKRYIQVSRITDDTKQLNIGLVKKSNNGFIEQLGGSLNITATGGLYMTDFASPNRPLSMLTIDSLGKLSVSSISGGGALQASLTTSHVGYGVNNVLSSSSNFTYLSDRYLHFTGASANVNIGATSSGTAGFLESVNGNLLLQARSTFGVVVDEGYFQVDALGGGGTKMVVVDNNGKFDTQTIPSGGGVPSLTATQIGFGDGSNLLTSSSNFTYNGSSIHFKNGTTSELVISYGGVSGGDYDFDCPSLYLNLTDSFNVFCDNFTINNGGIGTILGTEVKIGNTGSNTKVEIGFGGTAYTGNEIKLSGTPFKLSLGDGFGGAYTPSNGDKCTLTYDGSKGAFVLQKMNTYNDGTRTFLIL